MMSRQSSDQQPRPTAGAASAELPWALVESLPEALWVFDHGAYRYRYLNPAVEQVLSVSRDALYSDPGHLREVLVDDRDWDALARLRPAHLTFRIIGTGGDIRWIESMSWPLGGGDDGDSQWRCGLCRDDEGQLLGYGEVICDHSARRAAAQRQDQLVDSLQRRGAEQAATSQRLDEYSRRLQELSASLQQAQETERRHIARELHDDIGQRLTALKLNLRDLAPREAATREPLERAVADLDGVLESLRGLTTSLRPAELDDLGLLPALRRLVRRQSEDWGVPVDVHSDLDAAALDGDLQTACYRIAQEALHNALRHGRCGRVDVDLGIEEETLRLTVTDDGQGFEVAATPGADGGYGLLSMRERATLHAGLLEIDSRPGAGTRVTVRFPLRQPPTTQR